MPLQLPPSEILVLCDGVSDADLFRTLKRCHPHLALIPDVSVQTYDQARFTSESTPLRSAVEPLHIDDRPDFIFCHNNKPVLVVEMTVHAYTGDNGLQRFARSAVAAENGVPFIYFGPLRRVRDDELDRMEEGTASARSLTSDVFQGMQRVAEIFSTAQLYVEWKTSDNGMPISLTTRPSRDEIISLYGELLTLIATILLDGDPQRAQTIEKYQRNTSRLAGIINTRDSDVRLTIAPDEIPTLVRSVSGLPGRLDGGDYFDKGKPDKLLAKFALQQSSLTSVQLPDGQTISEKSAIDSILKKLLSHPKFSNPARLYYTGYKWRSDPHCGVLVNIDYRLCRSRNEKTPQDRLTPLIVAYPRISCNAGSVTWRTMSNVTANKPALQRLFDDRYGAGIGKYKMEQCIASENLFSLWRNNTKQARLFRRYADIVLLNDGILIGHSLKPLLMS